MVSAGLFLTFNSGIYSTGTDWALARARQVLCWPLGVLCWAKFRPCPQGAHRRTQKSKPITPQEFCVGFFGSFKEKHWTKWGDLGRFSRAVGTWDYLEECLKVDQVDTGRNSNLAPENDTAKALTQVGFIQAVPPWARVGQEDEAGKAGRGPGPITVWPTEKFLS